MRGAVNKQQNRMTIAQNIIKNHQKDGLRLLLNKLREGETYSKIGLALGVSKQRVEQWKRVLGVDSYEYIVNPQVLQAIQGHTVSNKVINNFAKSKGRNTLQSLVNDFIVMIKRDKNTVGQKIGDKYGVSRQTSRKWKDNFGEVRWVYSVHDDVQSLVANQQGKQK